VSVLPQLQQELSAAHARRRRRPRVGLTGAPVALAAAVAVAVVVVAVAGLHPGRSPQRPARPPAVVYRGFLSFTYAAGGSLYGVASEDPNSSEVTLPAHLVRIDPNSRGVAARRLLAPPTARASGGGGYHAVPVPQQMLLAAGSLWVTATDSHDTWLWRLDPRTLDVRSLRVLPGGGSLGTGSLALAGGWLWAVNFNTLIRISPETGRIAGAQAFSRSPTGIGNGVAADASGRTLVVTTAERGNSGARVEVLNPRTGAPIASSAPFFGHLGGVINGGAWISSLQFAGAPVRVDLHTLKVTVRLGRASGPVVVLDGMVELQTDGSWRCINPVTGKPLATIEPALAADGSTAYVQRQRGALPEIVREPIDPRCLARP
jgi:hypothetical protein